MPDHGVFDLVLFAGTSEAERARGTWSIKHVQVDPAAELAAIAWEESSAGQLVNLSGVGLIPVIDSVTTQYARMDGIRRMRYRERSLRYTIEFEATWDAQRRTGALWFAGPPEEKVCWGERLEDVDCP